MLATAGRKSDDILESICRDGRGNRTALAGCGGGSQAPMPKAKDAGQLLAEGVRLPVRDEGVREAMAEGRTTPANFNFSIRRNASGQFVVVVANHAHTFSDDELHLNGA